MREKTGKTTSSRLGGVEVSEVGREGRRDGEALLRMSAQTDPTGVKQILEREPPVSTYLVLGADEGYKQRAVEAILAHYSDPALRDWNTERVDAAERDGAAVADLVATAPMLGERRIVVVSNVEKLAAEEALLPFVEAPPGFSVLVLVGNELEKRRRLYAAAKRHGRVFEFEAPKGTALAERARALARAAGVELEPAAARLVVERIGDDSAQIEREVEKLVTYAGPGGRIGTAEAEALVSFGDPELGPYAVFEFVDALAAGDGTGALAKLDGLLKGGAVPLVVLTMIARQFRLLYAAIAWDGSAPEDAAKALGAKSTFPIRKAFQQARRWKADEIVAALEACATCDEAMKRGMEGRQALEALTVALAWRR